MNEDRRKVRIGQMKKTLGVYASYYIKPSSKFWKRYFNKKVRKGATYKRGNWFYWS